MKRFIWIPIILLLLSACAPMPTVTLDCRSNYNEGYNQGYRDRIATENTTTLQCCDVCILFPTTQQVLDFVALDDTDKVPPDLNGFVCADYTHQLSENAWAQNIPCYTVKMVLTYEGGFAKFHECVAFPVRDSSDLLFIEPQNDLVIHDVVAGSIPYVCAGNNEKGFCKFIVEEPILKVLVNK